MRREKILLLTIPFLFGACGFLLGDVIHALWTAPTTTRVPQQPLPLPHHIPKYPGNLTLRFAMVHDVIHERFPHHGPEYYQARNAEVRQRLDKMNPTAQGKDADDYFALVDDLGVGLAFLGRHQEAVDLMRDKLKRQEALGYKDRELYSTYANLGTILILWQLTEGVADVPAAKARIGESVTWINKAIAAYPQSHFGRESWQVVLEEFLLAVLDNPDLLLKYDMIGDDLNRPIGGRQKCFDEEKWLWQVNDRSLAQQAASYLKAPDPFLNLTEFRSPIALVGAEADWNEAVTTTHQTPVPFDEPALGIVGMWRMGAGANPHFALALGEIMDRVGQRYIAWTAFERACEMKDHYWPDPHIQDEFAAHCRQRQQAIEQALPQENWNALRKKFAEELAFGQNYQQEYREYESSRIAAGKRTDDPHFYDDFESRHGAIATPVGPEDQAFAETVTTRRVRNSLPWRILFAGLLACAAAASELELLKRRAR